LTSSEEFDVGNIRLSSWVYVFTPIESKNCSVSWVPNFEKIEYKNFSPRG
jgi:hypothetical protein